MDLNLNDLSFDIVLIKFEVVSADLCHFAVWRSGVSSKTSDEVIEAVRKLDRVEGVRRDRVS